MIYTSISIPVRSYKGLSEILKTFNFVWILLTSIISIKFELTSNSSKEHRSSINSKVSSLF